MFIKIFKRMTVNSWNLKYFCLCAIITLVLLETMVTITLAHEYASDENYPYFPLEMNENDTLHNGLEGLNLVVAGDDKKYLVDLIQLQGKGFYGNLLFSWIHFE
eukprot:Nk52_evm8s2485 gene=Nk52_evmTU8s2485